MLVVYGLLQCDNIFRRKFLKLKTLLLVIDEKCDAWHLERRAREACHEGHAE